MLGLGRMDVLAADRRRHRAAVRQAERNMVRYFFLDEGARSLYPEEAVAADSVAHLRLTAAADLDDAQPVAELIGELSVHSETLPPAVGAP